MIGDGAGKRPWVYVSDVKGTYKRIHQIAGVILIGVFFVAPWIHIAGNRLLLLDIPARRFHIFGATFSALDGRFLLLLLLFFGFLIGFVTSLLGRLWCGYTCPQTVWVERWFRRVEEWVEGNRGARRRLDEGPWNATKVRKKLTKWSIFLVSCWVISATFVSYFVEPVAPLWTFQASPTAYAFVAVFTGLLYFDFAWFREQFCNYLCPYARIQGAFADEHTLVVGYDEKRGEPRRLKGKALREAKEKGLVFDPNSFGDCIDCALCVTACPQGIDIRDGYQLECITCGSCIDACTRVMSRHGKESLISYTSEAELKGGRRRMLRPRPVIFAAILVLLLALMGALLAKRTFFEASVTRAPGQLFTVLDNGSTQNAYNAHILNNDDEERVFNLAIAGLDGAEMVVPFNDFAIAAGDEMTVPVFVLAAPDAIARRTTEFEFVVSSGDEIVRRPATFKSAVGER